MKRPRPAVLFLSLIVSLLAACATVPPQPQEPVHVVLVGTTDLHGWFNGHEERLGSSGSTVHYGGLPLLSSYLKALRSANQGHVVVVDSGDLFQGTLESNIFEGEPVIRAYNSLGYAASAVGNHEFDFGPIGPDPVARTASQDPLGALKKNAKLAAFPLLSANMVERATGKTPDWARRSTIVTVSGVKIGIIGLSTPSTPSVTMAENVASLLFTDPVKATISEAAALREAGVDAVVVIAHMGGRCTDTRDPQNPASCEMDQEAVELLKALPPGTVDAYFGGHTHARMRHFINGVPALQAMAYSSEFSTLDLWVDPSTHKVVQGRTQLRPHTAICEQVFTGTEVCEPRQAPRNTTLTLVPRTFEGTEIHPDPQVATVIAPYLQQVADKRNQKLGITTTAPFTRASNRESSLGDLLTDALRQGTGADIAFMNSGGIRANLRAGELVYTDVFEVSPFDNFPAVVTMTGAQLREALRRASAGDHGLLQVSGIRYTLDASKDADKNPRDRDRLVSVTLENGQPLDDAKLYKVAMPDFLAKGGDAMETVMGDIPAERVSVDLSRTIRDLVIDTMQKWPMPVAPPPAGRITVLNSSAPPDVR